MSNDPSADTVAELADEHGDESGVVEVVAASDEIVAHGPDAPADVAAAASAALTLVGETTAQQDRLRKRLLVGVYLALSWAWLGIGLAREWSEPRSWAWLWDVVAPFLATAWLVAAVATVTIVVLVVVRMLWRRPGQSAGAAYVELWKSVGEWPDDPVEQRLTMSTPLLSLAALGGTGLLLWPTEPYGDWNVVVSGLASVVAFVGLALLAEQVVLARHRADPRDRLVQALFQAYATAIGVAVDADFPVGWRRSCKARVELADGLDAAADAVERNFKRLAPYRLADARREGDALGRRIAAGFRVHAHAVLLGGRERDDRLAPALAAGLVAASRGQWEQLANAEPASAAPRIITSIARRVVVAGLLIGAGLLLATRFGDIRVQDQLRGVFLSAALLALVTPRSALQEVGDRVRQTVVGADPRGSAD